METNFQHYEKEILEISKQDDFIALVNGCIQGCKGTTCRECYFGKMTGSNCNINRILWGYRKYSPTVKLTHLELELLKFYFEKGYQYIAKDNSNALYFYKVCPFKGENIWQSQPTSYSQFWNDGELGNLFKFIKWEDNEPYVIEGMLNNYEVNKND